eukprot:s429_g23.t1
MFWGPMLVPAAFQWGFSIWGWTTLVRGQQIDRKIGARVMPLQDSLSWVFYQQLLLFRIVWPIERAVCQRRRRCASRSAKHSRPATDPLEAKRVIEAGGHIINDRVNGMLAMTRALGDHMLKMPMLPNDVVSNVPDITSTDVTKQVCCTRHSTKPGCRSDRSCRSRRLRALAVAEPQLLAQAEELALTWKPQGWSDGGRSSDLSKDFLAWAKKAIWRNEKEAFPLFRLGRASCGVSLVAGSSAARDVARQMQAEGLLVMSCALLVAGRPTWSSSRRGISLELLRSSRGLRHGVLSLVRARVVTSDDSSMGLLKLRALLQELGHPPRGPGGGKAWNSQVTIDGLALPGLRASVPVERLEHLRKIMEVDALRLERYHGAVRTSKSLFDAEGNGWMIFEGLRLKLRSDVFVPRGESRHLIQAATRVIEQHFDCADLRLLDVTIGVGNGLLPLLKRYPLAEGWGIDINPTAVRLANENAKLNDLAERCFMEVKDLKDWTLSRAVGTGGSVTNLNYDLVIANPPYSANRAERMESYQRDVEDAESSSGSQSILVSIAQLALSALTPSGRLVLQVPREETTIIAGIFRSHGQFVLESKTTNTLTLALGEKSVLFCSIQKKTASSISGMRFVYDVILLSLIHLTAAWPITARHSLQEISDQPRLVRKQAQGGQGYHIVLTPDFETYAEQISLENDDLTGFRVAVGGQLPAGLNAGNTYRFRQLPDVVMMEQYRRDATHAAAPGGVVVPPPVQVAAAAQPARAAGPEDVWVRVETHGGKERGEVVRMDGWEVIHGDLAFKVDGGVTFVVRKMNRGDVYSDRGPGGGEMNQNKSEKKGDATTTMQNYEASIFAGARKEFGDTMVAPALLEYVAKEVESEAAVMKQVRKAALLEYVAKEVESEAAVMKQVRKAREERAAANK